ncbi:helix-turn-helix domain-containing protein [Devosia lacusdianchii]|uniref:helix-turn-helix domain-containing protein n=1 Tax=Devosia lacusdianchii TaxID=2917991 RepID=UPI001F06C8D7|nr:helix-turn-helix transcriptional regulator [Devosia sp. JXJ CY 41]
MTDGSKPVFQKPAEVYEPRGRLDPAGFERHVQFRMEPPPEDLAPFIVHFWVIRWDSALGHYDSSEVMHRPYVDVFLSAQESGIQGTFRGKRTYSAAGSGRIIGMRFRPGAFHAFWRGQMADLQDKVVPLTQVFAWADAPGIARILARDDDAAIAELQALIRTKLPGPDETIGLINEIIGDVETDEALTSVSAVAAAYGKSERWLQQVFRDYLGIGLKWLLQRKRLLLAAAQIRESDEPDWVGIAYDLGYSSQQHFITDFRTVLGETPVQYKKGLLR